MRRSGSFNVDRVYEKLREERRGHQSEKLKYKENTRELETFFENSQVTGPSTTFPFIMRWFLLRIA